MNSEELKSQGNEAFQNGEFSQARDCYTQALSGKDAQKVGLHILYCNRSGANLGLGNFAEALADASAAIQHKPEWSKAFSRKGAAQMKLKDFAGAAESFFRAFEVEGKGDYEDQLVEALMCVFRGVHLTTPGKVLGPGQSWQPSDWMASIDQGGYSLLLSGASRRGPKWAKVRAAAVLQLAGLALCPNHRSDFFQTGGGAEALAGYIMQKDDIPRLKLPPRMQAIWRYTTGLEYSKSSLLLPAAVGLCNLSRLPSCVPALPLGLLMCEHGGGGPASVLRALVRLVDCTASCTKSQSEVASAFCYLVPAVQTQRSLDIFLDACGVEAMEKLMNNFKEEELESERNMVANQLRAITKHPYHPHNQIPGKELRDDGKDTLF